MAWRLFHVFRLLSSNDADNLTWFPEAGGLFGGGDWLINFWKESEAQNPNPSISDITGAEQEETYDYGISLGMIFEVSPKETLKEVKDVKFENIEVTYKDGSVQKVEPYAYHNGAGDWSGTSTTAFPVPYVLDQKLWKSQFL